MNDAPPSRKTTGYVIAATGVVAWLATMLAFAVSSPESHDAADQGEETTETETEADPQAAVEWLPYEPEELAEAGALAVEFAELYTRVQQDESAQAHHEALSELASADYAERLDPRPSSVEVREEMQAEGTTVSSSAEVSGIRDIVTGQVTVLVDCAMVTNTGNGDQERNDHEFAVTLLPVEEGWKVHELQLAEDGQSGDESGSMDS